MKLGETIGNTLKIDFCTCGIYLVSERDNLEATRVMEGRGTRILKTKSAGTDESVRTTMAAPRRHEGLNMRGLLKPLKSLRISLMAPQSTDERSSICEASCRNSAGT